MSIVSDTSDEFVPFIAPVDPENPILKTDCVSSTPIDVMAYNHPPIIERFAEDIDGKRCEDIVEAWYQDSLQTMLEIWETLEPKRPRQGFVQLVVLEPESDRDSQFPLLLHKNNSYRRSKENVPRYSRRTGMLLNPQLRHEKELHYRLYDPGRPKFASFPIHKVIRSECASISTTRPYHRAVSLIYNDFWWIRHPLWTAKDFWWLRSWDKTPKPIPEFYCIRWLLNSHWDVRCALADICNNNLCFYKALWSHDKAATWHEYHEDFQGRKYDVLERVYVNESDYLKAAAYSHECLEHLHSAITTDETWPTLCHVIHFDNSYPCKFELRSRSIGMRQNSEIFCRETFSYTRPGLVASEGYDEFQRVFFQVFPVNGGKIWKDKWNETRL